MCELRKLTAQRRTYVGLAAVVAIPLGFVAALEISPPGETTGREAFYLRYVLDTGFALPLLILLFSSIWFFPLVTALVAGDIVAAEDHNRTLKTILTRSAGRSTIFLAKVGAAFTYTLAAVALLGGTATVAGGIAAGFDPLPTFTSVIQPQRAALLVTASLAVYAMPVLAIASIGVLLSTLAKNSAGAVVGTLLLALLLQVTQIVPGLDSDSVQRWVLTAQLNAWQSLFRDPIEWEPIVRSAWVSVLYAVPCLAVAWVHFLRRDIAG